MFCIAKRCDVIYEISTPTPRLSFRTGSGKQSDFLYKLSRGGDSFLLLCLLSLYLRWGPALWRIIAHPFLDLKLFGCRYTYNNQPLIMPTGQFALGYGIHASMNHAYANKVYGFSTQETKSHKKPGTSHPLLYIRVKLVRVSDYKQHF